MMDELQEAIPYAAKAPQGDEARETEIESFLYSCEAVIILRLFFEKTMLTEIECEILTELFFSSKRMVASKEITKLCRISPSTWNKEWKSLVDIGLIEREERKEFGRDGKVHRQVIARLTPKGKLVVGLLLDISNLLATPSARADPDRPRRKTSTSGRVVAPPIEGPL